jgi:hypothetical protein
MRTSTVANSRLLGLLVVLVAFIIFMTVLSPMFGAKPPIEVNLSLSPTTIKENEAAKLTVLLKNLDLKTHNIRFVFDTTPRISIYAGAEKLLADNAYSFTLEATDPSEEKVFTVKGSLEEKTSRAEYPIDLKVYVDGNGLLKTWDDILLDVRKL